MDTKRSRPRRWEAAKKIGVVPENAELADRHPMIKPWDELSEIERAVEARGMEVYAGMLEAMDYHYGRVVEFLKDIGEYDNTNHHLFRRQRGEPVVLGSTIRRSVSRRSSKDQVR